jgi:hypothetical protein
MNNSPALKTFSAVFVVAGASRRTFFDAADESEARATCICWGVGLEGEAKRPGAAPEPLPEAYDAQTARRLLGGVSRTTLYKEIVLGNLQRVPGTRRVLITRTSIEKRCR